MVLLPVAHRTRVTSCGVWSAVRTSWLISFFWAGPEAPAQRATPENDTADAAAFSNSRERNGRNNTAFTGTAPPVRYDPAANAPADSVGDRGRHSRR